MQRKRPVALTTRQFKTLRSTVELVREHFSGFDARDGFKLTRDALSRLTAGQRTRLKRRARELRREMSQPYIEVRPRGAKETKALYAHTRAQKVKGRKTFLVHVPEPKKTRIEIVDGRVRETVKVRGARVVQEYFYFADYNGGREPKTMEKILEISERIVQDMPEGYYVFNSGRYGHIGAPMARHLLIGAIERSWLAYDAAVPRGSRLKDSRGLAQTLVGFKRVATTLEGAQRELDERFTRRARGEKVIGEIMERARKRRAKAKRGKRRAKAKRGKRRAKAKRGKRR